MDVNKDDYLLFANKDYEFIQYLDRGKDKPLERHSDNFIVQLQQCTEKYLKYMYGKKTGKSIKTHKTVTLRRMVGKDLDLKPKHIDILMELDKSYYNRRYGGSKYREMTREEFDSFRRSAMEMVNFLNRRVNSLNKNNKKIKAF